MAPVFDSRYRRCGYWLAFPANVRPLVWAGLAARFSSYPPRLLLLAIDGPITYYDELPLDCGGPQQVLVVPAAAASTCGPIPPGVLLGLQGTMAELRQALRPAAWFIATDPDGVPGHGHWLADGLANWDDAAPLITAGWEAFLFTGNRAMKNSDAGAERPILTQLLGLIARDADTDELEELLKHQPRLTFDLLKLVNSPAMSLRTPATSVRQAITILGRRQLRRWLQLLLFTRPEADQRVDILLWHSAWRGCFMERVARRLNWDKDAVESAFMVGVFSLLDVLMDEPLATLLQPLGLPETLKRALLEHSGPLGELLDLACALERRDVAIVARATPSFALDAGSALTTQFDCLAWVEKLSTPAAG